MTVGCIAFLWGDTDSGTDRGFLQIVPSTKAGMLLAQFDSCGEKYICEHYHIGSEYFKTHNTVGRMSLGYFCWFPPQLYNSGEHYMFENWNI